MSLAIRPEEVCTVLLADGKWHHGSDFTIDAFEFVDGSGPPLYSGGEGFRFTTDDGNTMYGPMDSVRAVDTEQR
jgi:hypothetical protein